MGIEEFKLERFREDHPGKEFPPFEKVPAETRKQIKEELAKKLGLPRESDALVTLKKLYASFELATSYDATDPSFDLATLVKAFNIEVTGDIYINWDRFDHVDKMRFTDLAQYFSYIWYSVSDDIEIFNPRLQWAILVRHDGAVALIPIL